MSAGLPEGIETIALAVPDHTGRLIGKRVPVRRWPAIEGRGLPVPDFHLATGIDNVPRPDIPVTGLHTGFNNGLLRPLDRPRFVVPTEPATLVVLADALRHDGGAVEEAPRRILAVQCARLRALGIEATVATELEFYLYKTSMADAARAGFRGLEPYWHRNADNDLLLTGRALDVLNAMTAALKAAGFTIEAVQGEGGSGQYEINTGHGDALSAADRHAVFKHVLRDTALHRGCAITFMAKPDAGDAGSGGHVHVGLLADGTPALGHGRDLSDLGRAWLGGVLAFTPELTLMHAPYANSYRRLVPGSFAPLHAAWGVDDRTRMVRLVADGGGARFEFRLPSADMNPYHSLAALIAAGIAGIEGGLEPSPEGQAGDAIPRDLTEAITAFAGSALAEAAFGPAVKAHILAHARDEQAVWRAAVTDWDRRRYFEYG